ncbi:MAG: hypothetical protein GOU99_00760 [Candidatus Altiarchaeota archaeon]|nr:hypothetical protein [Candidatus Altiarchaeota archaeon]
MQYSNTDPVLVKTPFVQTDNRDKSTNSRNWRKWYRRQNLPKEVLDYTDKKVAFFSDTHIHFPELASFPENRVPVPYGNGIDSIRTLESLIDWYLEDQRYDEVVLNGDILDVLTTDGIKKLLKRKEPGNPGYKERKEFLEILGKWSNLSENGRLRYVLGNHDSSQLLKKAGIVNPETKDEPEGPEPYDKLKIRIDEEDWTVMHGDQEHSLQKVIGFGRDGWASQIARFGPRPLQIIARIYGVVMVGLDKVVRKSLSVSPIRKTTDKHGNVVLGHFHHPYDYSDIVDNGKVMVIPKSFYGEIGSEEIRVLELANQEFRYVKLNKGPNNGFVRLGKYADQTEEPVQEYKDPSQIIRYKAPLSASSQLSPAPMSILNTPSQELKEEVQAGIDNSYGQDLSD